MFNDIHDADQRKWSMVASCNKDVHGLSSDHSYTILGAYTLSNGVKLFKMRNPWSEEGYDGPWNDNDSQWTDAFRQEVGGHKSANDGVFFIPVQQFRDGFMSYTTVAY